MAPDLFHHLPQLCFKQGGHMVSSPVAEGRYAIHKGTA
jgi:hypothetical protein